MHSQLNVLKSEFEQYASHATDSLSSALRRLYNEALVNL